MLIIGHRGSAGNKPENSIAALREAIDAGVDMIETDIRVTKDKQPVLSHNFYLRTNRRSVDIIRRLTLGELQKRTGGSENPIVTLDQALKESFGKVMLNIEIKERAAVDPMLEVLKPYLTHKKDWDNLMFSSFNPLILRRLRGRAPHAPLALLHYYNPLAFMAWHRQLDLAAVGFHRLHINALALEVAKKLDLFTYVYTVNRPDAAAKLADKGLDAIVTDYPRQLIAHFDAE